MVYERDVIVSHLVSFFLCHPNTVIMEPLATLITTYHEFVSFCLTANAKNSLARIPHCRLICPYSNFSLTYPSFTERMRAACSSTTPQQEYVVDWNVVIQMILSNFSHFLKIVILLAVLFSELNFLLYAGFDFFSLNHGRRTASTALQSKRT